MELNELEWMVLTLLNESRKRSQEDIEAKTSQFMSAVSKRVGIPLESLSINTITGDITDTTPKNEED